jgi:hypothetical protein
MSSRYLHHFQPDVMQPAGVCGALSGRANGPGSPIDRADWPDRFARVVKEGRPVCEECRAAFDAYLEGRPGLAARYGLPVSDIAP